MKEYQRELINRMSADELRQNISIWQTRGHHHLVVYAEERLEKLKVTHDVIVPVEECSHD